MQTLRLSLIVAAAALVLPLVALAQSVDELRDMSPQERRDYVASLSAEEREALRTERRARWEAMSDEERAAARERRRTHQAEHRAAMRQHWQSLSEEERAAARKKHCERMHRKRLERRSGDQL